MRRNVSYFGTRNRRFNLVFGFIFTFQVIVILGALTLVGIAIFSPETIGQWFGRIVDGFNGAF